jgi:hypothetical protein
MGRLLLLVRPAYPDLRLWLAWRHAFSPSGIVLGVVGVFGGILVLALYLLLASLDARGDVKVLLLGRVRGGN